VVAARLPRRAEGSTAACVASLAVVSARCAQGRRRVGAAAKDVARSDRDQETKGIAWGRRAAAAVQAAGLLAVSGSGASAKEATFRSIGNKTLGVDLPDGRTWTSKAILLPTHVFEQRVTADEPYNKWTVGVTIDDVMANSLPEVGSADQIAERIAAVERKKDGNIMTEVLSASRGDLGGIVCDTIEYRADTTRGFYHYLVRVALKDGKLFNVTSQALEDQWKELEDSARKSLATMRLEA